MNVCTGVGVGGGGCPSSSGLGFPEPILGRIALNRWVFIRLVLLRPVLPRFRRAMSLALMAILALLSTSCASVPQEAVVLSNLVGTQIAEHRASHEEFVRRYYASSRDVVEIFLRDRWVPEYLERFVTQSRVMDLLITPDEVFGEEQLERLREEIMAVQGIGEVRTPLVIEAVSRVIGDAERGQVMLDFAGVAMDEIEAQRSELLEPLYEQELEVLDRLAESYDQLQQAQTQLTAYLAATQDVTRSQDEILEAMGIRQIRDDAIERAVWLSERLAAAAKAGETAAAALEEMKAIIESAGADKSEGSERSAGPPGWEGSEDSYETVGSKEPEG